MGKYFVKIKKVILGTLLSLSLVGVLTACAPQEKKTTNSSTNKAKSEQVVKMTLGAMAAPDSAPLFVAQEKGYFKDEGIDADIQLFRDAIKRDAAVSAGQLDGTVTDIGMFTSYIKGKTGFKLGTSLTGRFGVVTKDPAIKTWKDLQGKKIANFNTAITNYYLYTNFKKRNLENNTTMVKVPELPTRLQVVKNGQADATMVPEPFLTMARGQGLNVFGISNSNDFRVTAMAFNAKLSANKELMSKFYRAYNKAVALLNKDPEVIKSVITKDLGMPQAVADKAKFPKYEKAKSVDLDTFKEVLEFCKEQNFFTEKITPEDYIMDVKAK